MVPTLFTCRCPFLLLRCHLIVVTLPKSLCVRDINAGSVLSLGDINGLLVIAETWIVPTIRCLSIRPFSWLPWSLLYSSFTVHPPFLTPRTPLNREGALVLRLSFAPNSVKSWVNYLPTLKMVISSVIGIHGMDNHTKYTVF